MAASKQKKPAVGGGKSAKATWTALRDLALSYPDATEHHPWGETVVKVRKKVFVFLGMPDGADVGLSVKLPHTAPMALLLPFAEPTGYGLGKAGWVTARFPAKTNVPMDLLRAWIDESYRAVAPKTLLKQLPGDSDAAEPAARPGSRQAAPSRR